MIPPLNIADSFTQQYVQNCLQLLILRMCVLTIDAYKQRRRYLINVYLMLTHSSAVESVNQCKGGSNPSENYCHFQYREEKKECTSRVLNQVVQTYQIFSQLPVVYLMPVWTV